MQGWFWFTNTNGKRDAMLTFAVWAFALVFFKILLGGNEFTIGNQRFVLSEIDAATIGTLLTPTLGAYVARRNGFFSNSPDRKPAPTDDGGDSPRPRPTPAADGDSTDQL